MWDGESFGKEVVAAVELALERATAPLQKRIAELEARAPVPGEKGDPGERGKDAVAPTVDDLRPVALEAVAAAFATMPAPKDGEPGPKGDPGEPGRDGRDAAPIAPEDVLRAVDAILTPEEGRDNIISAEVRRYLETFPPPAGEKGDPGAPGKDAEPVTDAQIAAAATKWLEANPPQAGKDGADGQDGDPGAKGDPGADGADGVGVAGALIDRTGNLVLTLTDGTTRDLGTVIGKDGLDGADGKDGERGPQGFGLEQFDSEIKDDGRTWMVTFEDAERVYKVEHQLDTMIFRGPYKAGQEYQRGDTVSCGGQLYHCNAVTSARPDAGSEDWTLCSRRGRDGKDADPAPMLRLIEDKFAEAEDRLVKRFEALLRSKGI